MRVVFMGSPDFSVPALEALVAAGHEIVCVYCQPPRPAGRGRRDRPTPVQARAEALGLPVRHPASLKEASDQADVRRTRRRCGRGGGLWSDPAASRARCAAQGCLNIHASLLPRWRGAAPIHRAVMAGDARTGLCIMRMEAGLDTGPVLLRAETGIKADDTTGSLHDRLSAMGAGLITEALARLDSLAPEPQAKEGVTYAAKIDKAEARVDWSRSAAEVDAQIRGLSPHPGAWTEHAGARLKLLLSAQTGDPGRAAAAAPGTVLDGDLTVACGQGAVRLLRLQRAGRGPQDAADFLHGLPIAPGDVLE